MRALPRRRRKKPRLLHPQRRKNMLSRIFVERLARKPLHQRSQYNEVNVTVQKTRSRVCSGASSNAMRYAVSLPSHGFVKSSPEQAPRSAPATAGS